MKDRIVIIGENVVFQTTVTKAVQHRATVSVTHTLSQAMMDVAARELRVVDTTPEWQKIADRHWGNKRKHR